MVHVALLSATSFSFIPLDADVYPSHKPQISGLIAKETPTKVLAEYSEFADIFSPDLTSKLPKHTKINYHAIKLVNSQQPPYEPIYSLQPVD